MGKPEGELDDPLGDLDEKSVHFSQLGSIQELSLSQLRDQIKKVMIPLLIKAFRYQMDLIPSARSLLKSDCPQDASLKEAYEQLKTLDHDLKNLQLWCQSCRSQIERALDVPNEEQKSIVATPDSGTHPGIAKSFLQAMIGQSSMKEDADSSKAWWKVFLMKKK